MNYTNEELVNLLIRVSSDNNEFDNEDRVEGYRAEVLKRMKKQRSKKKEQKFKSVPHFWWDYRSDPYTRDVSVIVECSSQKGVVAEFKNVDIERSIADAESLIKELERGNTSLQAAFDKYQQIQNNSSKLSQCHQYGLCANVVSGRDDGGRLLTTCDICPRKKR